MIGRREPGRVALQRAACCLAALLATTAAHADDGDRFTIGPPGCRVVNPNPQPDETMTWTGGCHDGMAEGDGTLDWYSAGKHTGHYVGHMHAGMSEGQGDDESLRTGQHYVGGFHAYKYQGAGVLEEDGGRLTATFENGEAEGEAEATGPGGTHFKGRMHLSLPEGPGRADDGHGNVFEGNFRQGVPDGPGAMTRGGTVMRGIWAAGRLSGAGTIDGPGRRHYEGMILAEQADGRGTLTFEDGAVYRGAFVHGARTGEGSFTSADGRLRYAGGWKSDLYDGHGRIDWNDGQWYEGELHAGKRRGHGTLHSGTGTRVGDFDEDLDSFSGVLTEPGGARAEGHWVHDEYEGPMVLTSQEGVVHETFRGGVPEGPWDGQMANGSHVVGTYREGELEGPITTELRDGTVVRGQMRAGLREGTWKIADPDGAVRYVQYLHDELVEGTPPPTQPVPPRSSGRSRDS